MSRSLAVFAFVIFTRVVAAEEKAGIDWQPWSDTIFERAQAAHKLVLLDLGAGWCHWCHVMDEVTYADPAVVALLREKYLAVRVDQDTRPDLANRYEDYGWPATIVFKWDGSELAKRSGYLPPKPMASMLEAFVDDPTPGPSVAPEPVVRAVGDAALGTAQRAAMRQLFLDAYDHERGGWGSTHKYLSWDALEYCLTEGAAGDATMEKWPARRSPPGASSSTLSGAASISTRPMATGIIRTLKRSSRFRRKICASWPSPPWRGASRSDSKMRAKSGAICALF